MVVSNVYYLPNIVTFFAYSCTDYLVNIDKPDFIFLKTNTVCTNYSTNNSNTTTLLFCFAFSKFFLGDNGQTKTGERFSSKYSATFYYFCPTLFRAATAAKDAKDWSPRPIERRQDSTLFLLQSYFRLGRSLFKIHNYFSKYQKKKNLTLFYATF